MAVAAPNYAGEDGRYEMVKRMFQHFDADGDGVLDWQEMAAVVVALNPGVKFTEEQLEEVVDTVFRFYSKAAGVTLGALLCIYDDIGGDVCRDFDALFLGHRILDAVAPSTPEEDDGDEEGGDDIADGLFSTLDDRLTSEDSSQTSSSFRADLVFFDIDGGASYPPMSEVEEIFSFASWSTPAGSPEATETPDGGQRAQPSDRRLASGDVRSLSFSMWMPPPSPSPESGGARTEERKRRRGETSWAGIGKLAMKGFSILRRKNRHG